MAGNLAPVMKHQFFDSNGDPLAAGKLYSYQAGTTTPQSTYTDSGLGTANANPVVLDASGYASVWLDPALSYKFVLKNSSDATQWTVDNVIGVLAADAVSTAVIQDGAVTAAKIGTGAVTAVKLDSTALSLATLTNLGITATVASNALTIALKDSAGSDPSATSPVKIAFRSSTATTGTPVFRSATAATSIVIANGSTLGHASATNEYIYVYAIDNAGTVELAVATDVLSDQGTRVTTTALTGNDDTRNALYSTTARTDVPIRLIARLKSSQATAGVWATAISEISLWPFKTGPRSEVRWIGSSGRGVVNTKIRRPTTVTTVGTAITSADSANDGGSLTINEDGVYGMSYTDYHSTTAAGFGISKNSTQLTTVITSITSADALIITNCNALRANCSVTAYLRSGDVIRAHDDGTCEGAAASTFRFTITKVSE